MERIAKAQATQGNSMTSYVVSKKTMEVNHKHSIMTELNKEVLGDKVDPLVLVMLATGPMLIIDQSQGCRLVGAVLENAAAAESFDEGVPGP